MRLAIISDIHGNISALKATFAKLSEHGYDRIICLGDVVGYGATPEDCIDFLAERGIETICGNHDYLTYSEKKDKIQPYAEYVIKWMQDKLDRKYINWLSKLPFKLSLEKSNLLMLHLSVQMEDIGLMFLTNIQLNFISSVKQKLFQLQGIHIYHY